ncbi:N-acetylmuramoyl-L-alanine amidase [Parabacteroides sp. PF5-9]|uniref:N-acetylmuramoyl-L-alanine amidase family protein n=1 Tax=Parabacteroides sp. PF5-9 TaxID=1742404 RepID=UPI002475340B|nr:N-acetylmuramoyl-L-alanine amidase [Parabacteroides sp. PF5-9]MDH6359094.1 N-acetylmuramoyl-L-alanine amidase [Parabacteroides sp. PF5-9]
MYIRKRLRTIILLLIAVVGFNQLIAQETASPKNGDGITVFLRRHGRIGADYQRQFIELNKGKLGKNNALKLGVKYTLPPLKTAVAKPKNHEPLFGSKLAAYQVTSSELKGACFYLVSGHGGPDPGAIGKMGRNELHEDEYAYDIMLRLARNLMMKGAKVHIIIQDAKDGIRDDRILANSKRETCMGSAIPLNQTQRLQQRCDKINALYRRDKEIYKRAIFIHIDSRSRSHQTDVFFYHSKSQSSKELAVRMRSTFSGKYKRHQPGRGFTGTVGQRNLYVLNKALPVSLYVELGNIQNDFDQRRFVLESNRQALANWMCEAFVADFKQTTKKK